MNMRVLVDMNLSPQWVQFLSAQGWDAVHWADVGDPRAQDEVVLAWARAHRHVLLTHDLDFGMILAATVGAAPSVIQVRAQDVLPARLGHLVCQLLRQYDDLIRKGALITMDESTTRARILPLAD